MKFLQKHLTFFTILFCLCVSLFLRTYNLNWDNGLLFHPDERNIANAVTKIHFFSQLNPGFFAYGGFSIYLYRATGDTLVTLTHDPSWVSDWGKINLIGRFYSALFSAYTILPLFFIAKKLFGKKTALLSILLYTFTVTSIQNAHFATTESSITFFGVLLCWLSLLWLEKPNFLFSVLLGIVFGISIATKTSAFLFILFPAVAVLLFILTKRKQQKKLLRLIPSILCFLITTALFALLLSPYSLFDYADFAASMHYESGVATGTLPVVYTLQFSGSIPYLFQIENFIWQLGPLVAIFSVVGMVFLILEPLKRKQTIRMIFWVFPLVYFLYVGSWHTKFLRYMMPVIPFFITAGSMLLISVQKRFILLGNTIILVTLLTTIGWAFAFFTLYTRPQTRVAASTYIYQHAKPGSVILTESWDDGLPVALGTHNGGEYQEKQLDMYQADGPQKIVYLASTLSTADYIAINSRRIYGTLMRLTSLYPITANYYKLLFAGKLGYENVGTFSSYPTLFGVTINDDSSEETFQVYDHPKAFIFKNAKHFSQQQLVGILNQKNL